MADAPIDYKAVLSDLEDRRRLFNSAVDTAIDSIRMILVLGGEGAPNPTPAKAAGAGGGNDFLGLSLVDGAKKHLRNVRQKQSNREIADGLEAGGFVHTSKDFVNTVGTALWRAVQNGDTEIFRQGRYWLLSEWAPGRRRAVSLRPSDMVAPEPDDVEVETAD